MATHSSIIAWRTPWTGELAGYSPWGLKESDMTEWLLLTLTPSVLLCFFWCLSVFFVFVFVFSFLTEVYLIHNIVLDHSKVIQLYICVCVCVKYILFQILFHYGLLQDIEFCSLWSLFVHFMYDSFHPTSPKLLIQLSPTSLFCECFLFCR